MVKEEIIEGLRAAVAEGDSLNKAMMSFYNSGYPKQDVEDAAKIVDAPQIQQSQTPQQQPTQAKTSVTTDSGESEFKAPQPIHPHEEVQTTQYPSLKQTQPIQKVSNYEGRPSPLGAVMIFVLVFFLLFLVGVLITIFLFKDELSGFFNSLL